MRLIPFLLLTAFFLTIDAASYQDQLENSEIAEIKSIDCKKLKKELLAQKEKYVQFIMEDPFRTDSLKADPPTRRYSNEEVIQDFFNAPQGVVESSSKEPELIISLTSFPPRITGLFLTIESLLRQNKKPNKVVLYLSLEEFPTKELPETLKLQQTRGLEVRWVKQNLKPYKKLIYALKDFSNSIILTVDDDRVYKKTLLEELLKEHEKDKKAIIGAVTFPIDKDIENAFLMACGAFGILYPPHSFGDEVFDVKTIQKINPIGDDEWFAAAAAANGIHFRGISVKRLSKQFNTNSPELNKIYGKELAPNLIRAHVLKHLCLKYFDVYNKLGLKPNPNVEKYLTDLKEKKKAKEAQ
jgi:hypothetical protein